MKITDSQARNYTELKPSEKANNNQNIDNTIISDDVVQLNGEEEPDPNKRLENYVKSNINRVENQKPIESEPKRKVTVLLFSAGNIESREEEQIFTSIAENLAKSGTDENIAFVAQMAMGSKGPNTQRILLKNSMDQNKSTKDYPSENTLEFGEVIENIGDTNTGLPETFADFLIWGVNKYRSDITIVVASGHGGGALGTLRDDYHNDILTIPEVEMSLNMFKEKTGKTIDILAAHSCLMGCAEMAYAARIAVQYLAGSEEAIFDSGWSFRRLGRRLKELADKGEITVDQALDEISDCQKLTNNNQRNKDMRTSAIIKCFEMPGFKDKLASLSDKLLDTKTPVSVIKQCFANAQHYRLLLPEEDAPSSQMRDIISIAREIIKNEDIQDQELKNAANGLIDFTKTKVITHEMHENTKRYNRSEGMSILAPRYGVKSLIDDYKKISLAQDARWDEVIAKFGQTENEETQKPWF
jgi:hypothetical protein